MTVKTLKIVSNPVKAALVDPDRDARLLVNDLLSFKIDSGPRGGIAHGSMFNMPKNQFPAGFLRLVKKKLELAGYKIVHVAKPAPEPLGSKNPVVDEFPDDPRYDYQPETVERLIKLKSMVAQIATGGGKSKVFKLCCERLGLPTLFLTTRKSLMYQMIEGYKSVKGHRPIGVLGDGKWSPQSDGVNFAIVDTLISRLEIVTVDSELDKFVTKHLVKVEKATEAALKKALLPFTKQLLERASPAVLEKVAKVRKAVEDANTFDEAKVMAAIERKVKTQQKLRQETLAFLTHIGFLTIEEAHEVSSNSFFDLCNSMPNAHYRLALTATPNMKDTEEANMRLMAVSGSIGIKVSEKTLIDRGILARPRFKFLKSPKPGNVTRGTGYAAAYERGIVNNSGRNQAIAEEVLEAARHGLTSMILVQRTAHGELLQKLLASEGLRVEFIYGENEQTVRQAALDRLGRGEIDCLIGTTILDVGVDVPSVGLVVLAGGGKAEVGVRQRVGRGLRAKKSGPNLCYVVMIEDNWNNHTSAHSQECRRIIESTPGFVENIVASFYFEQDGFKLPGRQKVL